MTEEEVKNTIEQELEGVKAYVSGNDHTHYQVTVVGTVFENKSRVARQKMVYQVLSDYIKGGDIHALELKTVTPSEWENQG